MNITLKLKAGAFDFKIGSGAGSVLCNSVDKISQVSKGGVGILSGELVFCSLGLSAPAGFSNVFRLPIAGSFGSKTKGTLGVWIADEVREKLRLDCKTFAQSECALNFGAKRADKLSHVVFGSPGKDGVYLNVLSFKSGTLVEAEDRLLPNLSTDSQLAMECRMVVDGLEQKSPGAAIYWLEPFPHFKDPRVKWVRVEDYLKESGLTRILPDTSKGVFERFKLSIAIVAASFVVSVAMVAMPLLEYTGKRNEALELHSKISNKLPAGRSLQEMAGWAALDEAAKRKSQSFDLAAKLVEQIPLGVKIREIKVTLVGEEVGSKPTIEMHLSVPLVKDETGLQEAQKLLLNIQRNTGVSFKVLSGTQSEQSGARYFEFVSQGEL